MKLYRIRQDGFEIGAARGKKNAVEWLKRHFELYGITRVVWGKFVLDSMLVVCPEHEFRIEEAI